MSQQTLAVNQLHFLYPDGHAAIKDISFVIQAGEAVGIIGANGSGKSTLLSLLLGIFLPNSGEISIGDLPVEKQTLAAVREKLGLVFQDSDDQLFMTTVFDDVAFGPRNYSLDESEVQSRVETALAMVGILHLKDRAPYKLSGGEKKAAAIASVLSMKPDVLIMDEPTTGLDPKSRRQLINTLNDLTYTKIITSHDLDMVMDTCERIIVINEGRVAADGPALEILTNGALLENCRLEMPLSLQTSAKIEQWRNK